MHTTLSTIEETENHEATRRDIRRWRADWHTLNEQIAETKKTMRAGYKGAHALKFGSPEWHEYAKILAAQGQAQSALHGLRNEATALLMFRSSLRGRVHAPKLDAERLRSIVVSSLSWEFMRAMKDASADQIRARIIEEIGSKYERSNK